MSFATTSHGPVGGGPERGIPQAYRTISAQAKVVLDVTGGAA